MRKIVETFRGGTERTHQVLTGPDAFGGWHVIAVRGKLRELLQGDVGVAAQVLKALVGHVVIERRQVEGQEKPQMVARFTINAVPALAVLDRGGPTDRDGVPVPVWDSIHASPGYEPATAAEPTEAIVPLVYDRRAAARKAATKRDGAPHERRR